LPPQSRFRASACSTCSFPHPTQNSYIYYTNIVQIKQVFPLLGGLKFGHEVRMGQ
jgi:hypothetical protein